MSRTAFVDAIGGVAGDMLLAALLDAGAPLGAVRGAVDAVLPGRVSVGTEEVRRAGLRAAHVTLDWSNRTEASAPRSLAVLREAIDQAALPAGVRDRARSILDRLAEAEARVHGGSQDELVLHEVGDDDTLVDMVGVAAGVDALGIDRLVVSSLPMSASGKVIAPGSRSDLGPLPGSHPPVPLPAPATLELLRGFEVRGEGEGESVTPTGAAILAALGTPSRGRFPAMEIDAVGYGAGTRDPRDRPNVVRVVIGSPVHAGDRPQERDLVILESNLDDLSPQLAADAAEALLGAGALDAWLTPVQMKKGRPGVVLSALCEPGLEGALRGRFFELTTTFGVRSTPVRRAELQRRLVSVELPDGAVRVKLGFLGDRVVTATPEHDDVAAVALRAGRPVRAVHEEAAAAARTLRLSGVDAPRPGQGPGT